jgi:hypothetical protein
MWSESPKLKIPFNSNSMAGGNQLATEFSATMATLPLSTNMTTQSLPITTPSPTKDPKTDKAYDLLKNDVNSDLDLDVVGPHEIYKKARVREAICLDDNDESMEVGDSCHNGLIAEVHGPSQDVPPLN